MFLLRYINRYLPLLRLLSDQIVMSLFIIALPIKQKYKRNYH